MENKRRCAPIPADNIGFFHIKPKLVELGKQSGKIHHLRIDCVLCYKDEKGDTIELKDIKTSYRRDPNDDWEKFVEDYKASILRDLLAILNDDSDLYNKLVTRRQKKGMTIKEFVNKYIKNIGSIFGWNPKTTKGYLSTLNNELLPFLPDCPMCKLNGEDYTNAIKARAENFQASNKNNKAYSDVRLGHFTSNLFCVAEYAVRIGVCDSNPLRGITKKPEQLDPMENMRIYEHKRKSLSIQATLNAVNILDGYLLKYGETLGTCLQLMAGLRPGEACGVSYRDLIYFKSIPDRCYLRVYTQVRSAVDDLNDFHSASLKTENGYRYIPVIQALQRLIDKKKEILKNAKYSQEQITNMPLAHSNLINELDAKDPKTNPANYRCRPEKLSGFSKHILNEAVEGHKSLENPNTESGIAEDGEYSSVVKDTDKIEKDAESYELRRNFATVLFGVVAMPTEDVQYLMGHKLDYDMYGRASDFVNEDKLIEMMKKMDRAIIFSSPSPIDNRSLKTKYLIRPGEIINHKLSDDIGQRLSIYPESEKTRIRVKMYIQAIEPNDSINITIRSGGNVKGNISPVFGIKPERNKTTNVMARYYDAIFGVQPPDDTTDNESDFPEGMFIDEGMNRLSRESDELVRQNDSTNYDKTGDLMWKAKLKKKTVENDYDNDEGDEIDEIDEP